jgi:hypothetical protein
MPIPDEKWGNSWCFKGTLQQKHMIFLWAINGAESWLWWDEDRCGNPRSSAMIQNMYSFAGVRKA